MRIERLIVSVLSFLLQTLGSFGKLAASMIGAIAKLFPHLFMRVLLLEDDELII
jgi:hypothetical protein